MHFERAAGTDRTLRRWVDDHLEFVARVVRGAGTPPAEVDDAVQRTFIIAARRHDDVRLGAERSFLLQTALNVAAHVRRSAARRREVPESELPERVDVATPEQLTSRKREQQQMERALLQLGPELRTVFVLFELEERTMAEISSLLQIPPGTVASRLRRAREQLREHLRPASHAKAPAAALGVGALVAAANAKAATSVGSLWAPLGWAKALLVAATALAVVAPAVYLHRHAASSTAAVSARTPARNGGVEPSRPLAASAPAALVAAEGAAPVELKARPPASVSVPKPLGSAETLRAELSLLDAARSRLASGRPEEALGLLDAYDRATPRGALKLEAEVLRIDALSRSGRLAQAQKRARTFLVRYPGSVLAARVRRIAGQ